MPELRKDPVTGHWVIISTDRQKRPNAFRLERPVVLGREQCPFCPGRESLTPPEILSYRQNGGPPNSPGGSEMLWITSSVTRSPSGRSSKWGEERRIIGVRLQLS